MLSVRVSGVRVRVRVRAVRVLNSAGQEAAANELGSIVVKTPMPPCFTSGLWENDQLYSELYFKKFPVRATLE